MNPSTIIDPLNIIINPFTFNDHKPFDKDQRLVTKIHCLLFLSLLIYRSFNRTKLIYFLFSLSFLSSLLYRTFKGTANGTTIFKWSSIFILLFASFQMVFFKPLYEQKYWVIFVFMKIEKSIFESLNLISLNNEI